MNILHVYGQEWWHTPLRIVGTPDGILALRNACDAALKTRVGEAQSAQADGEGYEIWVRVVSEDTISRHLPTAYRDEVAADDRPGVWDRLAEVMQSDGQEEAL